MIWPPSNWQPVVWVWLLGALCFVGLLAKTWRRDVPGAAAFRGLALANVIYIGTSALELVTTDPRWWYWIAGLMHLGIGSIGPCVALLFADVTGQNRWLTSGRRVLLIGAGLAAGALRFADPWLNWMYRDYQETSLSEGLVLHRFDPGPAFFVLQGGLIAGMVLGLALGWKTWREAGKLHRRHILLLTTACVIPVVTSTLFAFNLTPWGWLDPSPGGALVALAITSWAMQRDRLVGVAPVARNFLIEHFGDGVLVVDRARAVVDFNPAAQALLGLTERSSLGQPLTKVLGRWPALMTLCTSEQQTTGEIHPQPSTDTCWNAIWYPLHEPKRRHHHQGYMLVLSDITARKRTERQLHELLASRTEEWRRATTTALHAAEEEQTRIGRLLHDTLCQDLIGFRRTADAIAETLDTANSTRLQALGTDLADANRRARELAHLLEGPDLVHNSFEDALDATVLHLEKAFGLICEVTIDPAFPAFDHERGRHLLRIIREAIGNGARHGKARHVWVDLLAGRDRLSVTIANDGAPPPPPEELTEGLGSRQMRMRAALLGGTISLRPGTDGGAALELLLPLPSSPSA